jgi:carboxyl-terminal processing protease
MNRRFLAGSLVLFLTGAVLSITQPAIPAWANFENSPKHLVDEVWQVVNSDYVDKGYNQHDWIETRREFLSRDYATKEQAYTAIRKMLKELNDPYTRFMDPKQYASMQVDTSGELSGVGLSVDLDKTTQELVVIAPVPDTPAAKAGILPQDIIETIDGVATKGLSREEAVGRIRGKVGTKVTMELRRKEEHLTVTMERTLIPLQVVRSSVKEEQGKRLGYVALSQFTGTAPQEMRDAVKGLIAKNVDGFILDLRFNPGGLVGASQEIASIFLDKELIVTTVDRAGTIERLNANGQQLTAKPLVVLVNGGSASASEILSGALQDNKRAVLVGTTTFGKGLVQSVHELSDHSGLAVTTQHYKTPIGRDIHHKGIKPDFEVELPEEVLKTLTPADIASSKDPQFSKAAEVLLSEITAPTATAAR